MMSENDALDGQEEVVVESQEQEEIVAEVQQEQEEVVSRV